MPRGHQKEKWGNDFPFFMRNLEGVWRCVCFCHSAHLGTYITLDVRIVNWGQLLKFKRKLVLISLQTQSVYSWFSDSLSVNLIVSVCVKPLFFFFLCLTVCVCLLAVAQIDCLSIVLCWGEYCSSCSHVANIFPDHPPIDSGCCRNGRVMCFPVPQSSDKQPLPRPPITLKITFWSGYWFLLWQNHLTEWSDHRHMMSLEVRASQPSAVIYQASKVH